MRYSLPLEHFETTGGLLIGPLAILLCLSERGSALGEGKSQGIFSGAVSTLPACVKSAAVSQTVTSLLLRI